MLIGEPGVGKTAIVEGLAQAIVFRRRPGHFGNKQRHARWTWRARRRHRVPRRLRERLKKSSRKSARASDYHLVHRRNAHRCGRGSRGRRDRASNILKPALARGEFKDRSHHVRRVPKIHRARRRTWSVVFSRYRDPPAVEDTVKILAGLRENIRLHHRSSSAMTPLTRRQSSPTAISPDRYLPDKAIDLIDEAGSRAPSSDDGPAPNLIVKEAEIAPGIEDKDDGDWHRKNTRKPPRLRDKKRNCRKAWHRLKRKWRSEEWIPPTFGYGSRRSPPMYRNGPEFQ